MNQRLIFDKYGIIRRLAVGGMGEIFLARQSGVAGFDRWVILKSMLPSLAGDESAVNMFLDEARLAATLSHPNIISMYEVGRWEGSYFIAMEYLPGDNLAVVRRAVKKTGVHFPAPLAARIIHDAALGLDHAHHSRDAGGKLTQIIHRDVSPHNIMVTVEGMTKVVDFGIAKAVARDARTQTQLVRGKLRYMPPEQLLRDPLDGRSDQFALGLVFWELLTGRHPFEDGESDLEVALSIAQKPIPKPSSVRSDVSKEIDAVVMRMLQRTPNARFPRCLEVAKALEPCLGPYLGAGGTQAVGELVDLAIGDEIKERTENVVAPVTNEESARNFVISLEPAPPPKPAPRSKVRTAAIAIGVFAGVLFAATIAGRVLLGEETAIVDVKDVPERAVEPVKPAPAVVEPVVEKPVPKATVLEIRSSPPGARVYRGLSPIGETPLELEVAPGVAQEIAIKKPGFADYATSVSVGEGERRRIEVALAPVIAEAPKEKRAPVRRVVEPAPPPEVIEVVEKQGPGYLTIDTKPWSQVTIAGRYIGLTPLFKIELPAGKHVIQLVNDDAKINAKREVIVKANETNKVFYELR